MATPTPPAPSKSLVTRQLGPMPVWAWGGIGIALAVVYSQFQAHKGKKKQVDTEGPDESTTTPPNVYQDYITVINTPPQEPPGQGRETPPAVVPPVTIQPVPSQPPGKAPAPPAKKPVGHYVQVVKWTARNTPWNSTIWGIAQKSGIKDWRIVWNAAQNKQLRQRRKDPKLIQPGDVVFVPTR